MSQTTAPAPPRWTRTLSVLATILVACTAESVEEDTPQPASSGQLVGVVGHWADTIIGGPALVANGEAWSGQSEREALDSAGRRLFNEASGPFIANASSPTAFPFAVASDILAFGSGTLRVEFNLVGGESDQIAGLLFGLRPTGEYYYVRYNTKDGNLALWTFRNGDREVIVHGDVHKQLPLGAWHELVVEIRGPRVRGYVEGDTTISVEHVLDTEPVGRVGVWAKRDAITAFRSFTATP